MRSRKPGTVPRTRERNPLTSCASEEHYTRAEYVEPARHVLGAIDLDPASSARANETVKAATYYTKEDDGLSLPWFGRVFVNPPGERTGRLVRRFWQRACEHAICGGDDAAVLWIGFALGQLRTLQVRLEPIRGRACPSPLDWPHVVLDHRMCFDPGLGAPGRGDDPMKDNYICLLGGDREQRARFRETFGGMGAYQPGRWRGQTFRGRDLESDVLAVLSSGPTTAGELVRVLRARRAAVLATVATMAERGALTRIRDGRRLIISVV